jgi:hypothetical protein
MQMMTTKLGELSLISEDEHNSLHFTLKAAANMRLFSGCGAKVTSRLILLSVMTQKFSGLAGWLSWQFWSLTTKL